MFCSVTHTFLTVHLSLNSRLTNNKQTRKHTGRAHLDQHELSGGMWAVHTTPTGADDGSRLLLLSKPRPSVRERGDDSDARRAAEEPAAPSRRRRPDQRGTRPLHATLHLFLHPTPTDSNPNPSWRTPQNSRSVPPPNPPSIHVPLMNLAGDSPKSR